MRGPFSFALQQRGNGDTFPPIPRPIFITLAFVASNGYTGRATLLYLSELLLLTAQSYDLYTDLADLPHSAGS